LETLTAGVVRGELLILGKSVIRHTQASPGDEKVKPPAMKPVRSATIIKLIFAFLVGALAAVATYELVRSPQFDLNVDRGSDSLGPIF
jgi:hypothetical protein